MTIFTWPEGADRNDPDTATKLMVINGSYLRRDGKLVLDSLSKVYLCATKINDSLDVQLQGQPVINALLRSPQEPAKVYLNGQPIELIYDRKAKNLWLPVRTR